MDVPTPPVFVLDGEAAWKQLFQKVSDDLKKLARPRPDAPPLKGIIERLKEVKCTSALIQYPYDDEDFLYDYVQQHAWCYRERGRTCARIHFFAGTPVDPENVLADLRRYAIRPGQRVDPAAKPDPYLGFVVVRPTNEECVGRTIIMQPYLNDPVRQIHVRGRFRTRLYGVELEADGTPAMQQDRSAHVCAGAALWSLCYYLHRRYGARRVFPREVTAIATQTAPHWALAQGGLSSNQMSRVLRDLGCQIDVRATHLGSKNDPDRRKKLRKLVDVLYGYVISGVPVVVGYWFGNGWGGHAVLAVGHDLRSDCVSPPDVRPSGSAKEPVFDSDYCSRFYVVDDQRGPYQELAIWADGGKIPTAAQAWDADPHVLEHATDLVLVAGLPRATQTFYEKARKIVGKILLPEMFDQALSQDVATIFEETRLRVTLQQSARFRELLLDAQNGRVGLQPRHQAAYRLMPLSRYIYVCELCRRIPDQNRRLRVRAEILLDSTSPAFEGAESVLAVRLENHLYARGLDPIEESYATYNDPLAPIRV